MLFVSVCEKVIVTESSSQRGKDKVNHTQGIRAVHQQEWAGLGPANCGPVSLGTLDSSSHPLQAVVDSL